MMDTETDSGQQVRLSAELGGLFACPLCGAGKGYTLGGSIDYKWWSVYCSACGDQVSECRSDRRTTETNLPAEWPPADEAWNEAGAYAQRLRDLVAWAYGKLHQQNYSNQEDALMLDAMKLLLEHGAF